MTKNRDTLRSAWPVRVVPLGAAGGEDLSATTTWEQRLEMVWSLTREAWEVSGRPWPEYERAQTPVKVSRIRSNKG